MVEHLRRLLAPRIPLATVLDVGCGTGLSTRPLRAIAREPLGLDPSPAMLREAARRGGACYSRGLAEQLPFGSGAVELVTIGCAYHWCEPEAFLAEALRVLSPGGHLVIYDNFFFADSPRSPALLDWLRSEYWARLPRTPRNPLPEPGSFDHPAFELVDSRFLETWVPMSRERVLLFLTTQSGAVSAVESGERSLPEIESLLRAGLARLVPEEEHEFHFGGPLWVVRPRN